MTRPIGTLLALCVSLALVAMPAMARSPLTADEAMTVQGGLIATADGFILPAYETQADAAADLAATLEAHCDGTGDLAEAKATFADTFLAWQRASLIGIGPIAEAEGPARVQFWPDPKGFARRAVRAALRAEDPALTAPGGLAGRSIALTNLTALEELLHDVEPTPGTYACDLALAVARHQAGLAANLAAAWTPGSAFRAQFDGAAEGNASYAGVEPVIRELLAGAVVHVDRLRKFKLLRGLGTEPGAARPERTEARASGLGLASIEVSHRALADLYDVPLGLFDAAPTLGGSMDYITLAQTASSVADALARDQTLADIASEDGEDAAELRGYADLVLYHEAYLKTGFPTSIGLISGFTAADGD